MSTPPFQTPPANIPQPPLPTQPGQQKQKNTVGLIAIITAVIGFVFACIPGALIVGWILLPISFILGIVGLFQAGKRRGTSIAAIIISIVGIVVGFVVFFAVVSNAVDDAFHSGVTVSTPEATAPAAGGSSAAHEQGTRANPYPLGSTITGKDWKVTVNSVTLNADDDVAAANQFNDVPPAGSQYLLANVTVTYTGHDPQGDSPTTSVSYVTATGNTVNSYDSPVVTPDELDTTSTLFENASTTGNVAFAVPTASAAQGTLAVEPTMFADKVFVAVS